MQGTSGGLPTGEPTYNTCRKNPRRTAIDAVQQRPLFSIQISSRFFFSFSKQKTNERCLLNRTLSFDSKCVNSFGARLRWDGIQKEISSDTQTAAPK